MQLDTNEDVRVASGGTAFFCLFSREDNHILNNYFKFCKTTASQIVQKMKQGKCSQTTIQATM